MEISINEPIDHKWTPEDVVEDYRKYQDKKKVAKIYGITTKEVTQIINMNKIYLSEEEMEFILSYRKANTEDKKKAKEILKTEGDGKCLREETNASS